jgi:hypothetical protein
MKFPRSKIGLVLAILYSIFTIMVIYTERTAPPSGGFITLQGLGTFVITLPASLLLYKLFPSLGTDSGHLISDPMSPSIFMTLTVLVLSCAFLVYLFGALLGALGKFIKGIFSK